MSTIYYVGNSDIFKYLSPRNGKLYVWKRTDQHSHSSVKVKDEDAEDIMNLFINECRCHNKRRKYFLTEKEYKVIVKEKGKVID